MRNICNQKYVNECIGPIMRLVFPVIQKVLVVRSDDSDLKTLVRMKNGRVITPFAITDKSTFHQLNKFCLDMHPEIDGYVKSLSQVHRDGLPMDGDVSRADFTNRFHLCWSIMQSTSVVSTEGTVLEGPDEILPNREFLPAGVELVQDPGPMTVMMGLTGAQYFGAEIYKCIEF